MDLPALDRLLPFCQSIGLQAYVRLAEATRPNIQHALDIGADAIVLPQLRDLAHAREVTEYAKFAPRGTRGVGYSRTQRYQGADDNFFRMENEQRHCYAMIETAEAFADAPAIAALPCVDGLFMGPADLSMARGRGAFAATDADLADLRHIATAAIREGKRWAVPAANPRLREAALALVTDLCDARRRSVRSLDGLWRPQIAAWMRTEVCRQEAGAANLGTMPSFGREKAREEAEVTSFVAAIDVRRSRSGAITPLASP